MAIGDIIVGIDIGTSKVCTVVGEVNNFGQIEIICNNILYSDIMGIQLRVVKESKRGKRVKAAEEEEKKVSKRKQNEIIDKIFLGKEMTDEEISEFIHGMSNYREDHR